MSSLANTLNKSHGNSPFKVDSQKFDFINLESLFTKDGENARYHLLGVYINKKGRFGAEPLAIIDGFKELALLGKEKVSTAYMTLCTMLQDCEAWRTNREEIKNIFVEKNNTAPGTINYNYSAGATHYDHHREITIKKEDNKLLRKE